MKIGIMTMQRIKNYGSFLQAYGLKNILEKMGHEVCFVDYEFEQSLITTKRDSLTTKIKKNKNPIKYLRKKIVQKKYDRAFDAIYIPELCGKVKNLRPKNIDLLIIGSDEVFNCLQDYPVGYSRELFGKGYENIPVISYAACFGQTDLKRLEEYKIDEEIKNMLKKFRTVSVRDQNSYDIVKKLIGKKPFLHLDPVLIADFEKQPVDIKINNYILLYAYPGRLTSIENKAIRDFAKRHHKKIVSLGMPQDISDIEIIVHPLEIFSYFKNADFVITDTFHGSIFSIKTGVNFCAIIRNNDGGNNNKLADLLHRLGLEDRIVSDISSLDFMFKKVANYDNANKVIAREKIRTKKYLETLK